MTRKQNGLIFYNGPIRNLSPNEDPDFILLELRDGFPQLRVDHGSGERKLRIDGKDSAGIKQLNALNDGNWHRIDIYRSGKVGTCRRYK